jgi:lipopolysaccharide/colanic/teichoic acid biosynthesis glycosyltransferase
MYKRFFKRLTDIVISFGGLLLASPVMLLVLLYVYLKTRENPFFFQKRPGRNAEIFTLVKLRTMENKYDAEGKLLPDKDRTTRWGKLLRETSLDEIPQLINVLKGDMSLIGPRPLLPQYLPLYSDFQKRRHQVRPGITGWAQINGRNSISWQQKFDLDVWYVEHVSLSVDVKIILQTLKKVIRKSDVNCSESITMPVFDGTN